MRLKNKFFTHITVDNVEQKFRQEILPYLQHGEEG